MFDHRFLQHIRFPFSMAEYKLVFANPVSKNKALRNILLLPVWRKALIFSYVNIHSKPSYLYLTSCFTIYYSCSAVKLILYNFVAFCNSKKKATDILPGHQLPVFLSDG